MKEIIQLLLSRLLNKPRPLLLHFVLDSMSYSIWMRHTKSDLNAEQVQIILNITHLLKIISNCTILVPFWMQNQYTFHLTIFIYGRSRSEIHAERIFITFSKLHWVQSSVLLKHFRSALYVPIKKRLFLTICIERKRSLASHHSFRHFACRVDYTNWMYLSSDLELHISCLLFTNDWTIAYMLIHV